LDAVFSKGKPHIKKEAPTAATSGGEQIKGEQQGEIKSDIFSKLPPPPPPPLTHLQGVFTGRHVRHVGVPHNKTAAMLVSCGN